MPVDFLPKRENDLLHWSANFRAEIAKSPSRFGLSAQQTAEYAAVQELFATKYQLATHPDTRTTSQVGAKNNAKRALQKLTRQLAKIVRGTPGVTREQRATLGLSLEDPGGYRPPIGPPKVAPGLRVVSVMSRTVRVRVYDIDADHRRGMPRGCVGAVFLSFVGEVPPIDVTKWRFAGQTSKPVHEIDFGPEVEPFTKVWIAACWENRSREFGPMSAFVSEHVLPGVAKAA